MRDNLLNVGCSCPEVCALVMENEGAEDWYLVEHVPHVSASGPCHSPVLRNWSCDVFSACVNEAELCPLAGPEQDYAALQDGAETVQAPRVSDRLLQWQRRLLDLSLRNRLLNFRLTGGAVQFECERPAELDACLEAGSLLRMVSRPEVLSEPDVGVVVTEGLSRGLLETRLPAEQLRQKLTELYRQARSDLAEGGTNTLFLTFGFLRWQKPGGDGRWLLAPLLLVPVELRRSSAAAPFELQRQADDTRLNPALVQLLKHEFQCDVSGLIPDCQAADSPPDAAEILRRLRVAIRFEPALEIMPGAALATFAFSGYLLWQDLTDRAEALRGHRVLRRLLQPEECGLPPEPMAEAESADRLPAGFLKTPLPADGSQLAAVVAAAAGRDFVLIGPPGTGKSQTIANIISQCLSQGRSVLFVAEKSAALAVVHRRLQRCGLGERCLDLHDGRAERRSVLQQLQTAWQATVPPGDGVWQRQTECLEVLQGKLNAFCRELHGERDGSSVWAALERCLAEPVAADLEWSSAQAPPDETTGLRCLQDVADSLGSLTAAGDLSWVRSAEWSLQWEHGLLQQGTVAEDLLAAWQAAMSRYAELLGVSLTGAESMEQIRQLQTLATCLSDVSVELLRRSLAADADGQLQHWSAVRSVRERLLRLHADLHCRYAPSALLHLPAAALECDWRDSGGRLWPVSWWVRRQVQRRLQGWMDSGICRPEHDLSLLSQLQAGLPGLSSLLGVVWPADPAAVKDWFSVTGDLQQQLVQAEAMQQLVSGYAALLHHRQCAGIRSRLQEAVHESRLLAELRQASQRVASQFAALQGALGALCRLAECDESVSAGDVDASWTAGWQGRLESLRRRRSELRPLTVWNRACAAAAACGLEDFVQAVVQGRLPADQLPVAFQQTVARWQLRNWIDASEPLRGFQGFLHESLEREFAAVAADVRGAAVAEVLRTVGAARPELAAVSRNSGLGLLRHQMQLKRPSCSIRRLLGELQADVFRLTPCVLMSPLSVAQFLPAEFPQFDVVIFDEASQITPWNAAGALGRGRQAIIVGDPQQLPPTQFFAGVGRAAAEEPMLADQESILEEALAAGLPALQLRWHYRSHHESLIAFSNQHYYGNSLVTLPSAELRRAVEFVRLPDSVYDRGASRTNRLEAERIVADAVELLLRQRTLPASRRQSLGIITFNQQQQKLIEDLLDEQRQRRPDLEDCFSEGLEEPVIVRNLENVQGDERDVIFFSIAFGLNEQGHLPLTFGALNRAGGERRLNVAVTRARQRMVVYSSITGEQISGAGSVARGVRDLRNFLLFASDAAAVSRDPAETGPDSTPASKAASPAGRPLLQTVAAFLQLQGFQVHFHVGQSGHPVELAVVDPGCPDRYLAALEPDSPQWAAAPVACDREVTRRQLLQQLGWVVIRIHVLDWWYDPARAGADLLCRLTAAREVVTAVTKPAADIPATGPAVL